MFFWLSFILQYTEGSATDYEKQVYYKMILQLIDFEEVKEIAIKRDFHFGEVSLFLEEDLLFEYFLIDILQNSETTGYNDVYFEIAMGDNGRKYIMDELREQFLTSRARIVYWEKLVDDSIKFKNTH